MAPSTDRETLAEALDALAHPNRLRLVDHLQDPSAIGDLELAPDRGEGSEGRIMTREGVRYHLEKLRDQDYVDVDQTKGADNRYRHLYSLREEQIFQVCEHLLGLLDPRNGARRLAGEPDEPRLVLVHGVERGQCFPLGEGEAHVLGTGPEADLQLRGDPDVADQHAEVESEEDGHAIVDYRNSGTTKRNWRPLDPGDARPLTPGDVIELGSTLLVYQA